jgi:hypothetical protein
VAGVVELVAVVVIVAFVIGGVFAVILVVAAGIHAEENVARKRRSTTLHDQAVSDMTRGVRRLTGVGSISKD